MCIATSYKMLLVHESWRRARSKSPMLKTASWCALESSSSEPCTADSNSSCDGHFNCRDPSHFTSPHPTTDSSAAVMETRLPPREGSPHLCSKLDLLKPQRGYQCWLGVRFEPDTCSLPPGMPGSRAQPLDSLAVKVSRSLCSDLKPLNAHRRGFAPHLPPPKHIDRNSSPSTGIQPSPLNNDDLHCVHDAR
jgi:hypothetical protein